MPNKALIATTRGNGGADFSASQSNLEPVNQYIAGQEEHHRKIGFQDELRALLRKHEIERDEKISGGVQFDHFARNIR
jgi:hypothetical protein